MPPYDVTATEVDWRTQGVVRAVRDQGGCGSCWAFSTVANSESAYAIKTGQLYDLSEQHPVDCSSLNYGCDGGWMEYGALFLTTNGAILEKDYPYTSGATRLTGKC